jgi:hypothetical protein
LVGLASASNLNRAGREAHHVGAHGGIGAALSFGFAQDAVGVDLA